MTVQPDRENSTSQKDNFVREVFPAEIDEINRRRVALGQQAVPLEQAQLGPSSELGLIGLCFSGGGIRSSSFNLGVLQAAVEHGVLAKIDYLSTVSGGGYIGGCMSAVLNGETASPEATTTPSKFPLHPLFGTSEKPSPAEKHVEPPGLRHLRGKVSFLASRGLMDLVRIPISLVGGALSQSITLLPFLTFAGMLLVLEMLHVGDPGNRSWPVNWSLLGQTWLWFLALLVAVALVNSRYHFTAVQSDRAGLFLVVLFAAGAAFSCVLLLPACVPLLGRLISGGWPQVAKLSLPTASSFLIFQAARAIARSKPKLLRGLGLALVWSIGPALVLSVIVFIAWWIWLGADEPKGTLTLPPAGSVKLNDTQINIMARAGVMLLYTIVIAFIFSPGIDVNSTSMYGPYRDALSRTFLFNIATDGKVTPLWRRTPLKTLFGQRFIDHPVDEMLLSQLGTGRGAAPYHLINGALNTQNSADDSLRNRKADFFLFSKRFVGAASTGYCPTDRLEEKAQWLTLGSAVAISGAAAAPNMGTTSIPQLTFILSMLNIRLGVWLPNPLHHREVTSHRVTPAGEPGRFSNTINWIASCFPRVRNGRVSPLYLLPEITRRLKETTPFVNVTDGGHIDNLGLYELLKRRCSVIFVSDAEADPATEREPGMRFQGLCRALGYAHPDLGLSIDPFPYQSIQRGPAGLSLSHVAYGRIKYASGPPGTLIYFKSSLTGDEPPQVAERRRADQAFPHTPTSDQFFDESDFEAYRTLGHHIGSHVFARRAWA